MALPNLECDCLTQASSKVQTNRCCYCCGCKNRTMAYIVGWLDIVSSIIIFFYFIASNGFTDENGRSNSTTTGISIAMAANVILALLMLFGVWKEKPILILVYVALCTLPVLGALIYTFVIAIFSPTNFLGFAIILLWAYFLWCTFRYYKELKRDQQERSAAPINNLHL